MKACRWPSGCGEWHIVLADLIEYMYEVGSKSMTNIFGRFLPFNFKVAK